MPAPKSTRPAKPATTPPVPPAVAPPVPPVAGAPVPPVAGGAPDQVTLPDRNRTSRRFRGQLAARHEARTRHGLSCEITLWKRTPRGWAVGLAWTDGDAADARSGYCDTLDAAFRFVETEGPAEAGAAPRAALAKAAPALDPAEALVRPFLRRQAAAQIRQLYDELAGRALKDWQAALDAATGARS